MKEPIKKPVFNQVLEVEETDDEDFNYLIKRLALAVSDPYIREQMNKEDEFINRINDLRNS